MTARLAGCVAGALLAWSVPDRTAAQTPVDSASILMQQGLIAYREGGLERALGLGLAAATILRRVRSPEEAGVLGFVGLLHARLGSLNLALDYYRQALVIRRAVGDRRGEGATLNDIGAAQLMFGFADSALVYFRRALMVYQAIGGRGEGTILHNIGGVYALLARRDSALAYYRQALVVRRAVGDRGGEGATLNNICVVYQALDQPDSALTYCRQALAIRRAVDDRMGVGMTFHNIGLIHHALGQLDSALTYYRSALAIRREVGDRQGEGGTRGNIGRVHHDLGRPDSALSQYRQALVIQRALADRVGEGNSLAKMGLAFHRGVSPPALHRAVAYYDSAGVAQAGLAARVGNDPNRVSFAEQQVLVFSEWALAWLARASEVGSQSAALAALAVSERGRSQALLELMRGTREVVPGRDLVNEGRQFVNRTTASGTALLYYVTTPDTLLVWVSSPAGNNTVLRRAVSRDTLAALVGALRASLGVTEAGRGRVAQQDGQPLDPNATWRGTQALRRGNTRSFDSVAAALSRFLLPVDVAGQVGTAREIVIVPHGPLGLVPFAALPLDAAGTPLGSRYALRYTPSLAALGDAESLPALAAGATRTAALSNALVVGNPMMARTASFGESFALAPLPQAELEGRWVAARLGTTSLTGADATEVEVRRRLPGAPVVHLATHGYAYASEARARLSFVALAPDYVHDGFLTVGEVLDDPNLRLSAELVVLSACQTGLGDLKQAEGTVGLQRAFLAKGARTVLVSLWSVSDAATELLMRGFYTHWLSDPDAPSKAEALRRAQQDVHARPAFREPRYWAAFQLVGAR